MSTSFRKDACIHLPALVGGLALAFLSCVPRTDAAASDPNQGWIEVRSPHFTVATNASERDGRHIASQFEQMRGMFHAAFSTFRVDTPQPIYIIAAKNEGTMKLLLTEEWEAKGHVHPAGMYQHGEDKDYVLLQVDAQGSNPFHVVYHEYTHALLHLNFSALPLWLDEGLAEFFGNSTLGEKESRTGTVDANTIYFLQQNRLIPIDTLLQVDHTSKFYNEANKASVFYAESWALVHYLMMNPEARQRGLLAKFTAAWEKSENQVQAAQEAFGDLRRFADVIEGYAHQQTFMMGVVKTQLEDSSKEYSARHITAGEALALRGDFMAHAGRMDTAKPAVEEAVRLEPKSAFAHETLGYYLYRKGELDKADAEMKEALADGDTSFGAAYLHGMLLGRQAGTADTRKEALESLKKATELNPKFAPAFDMLAYVYGQSPDEQKQALEACVTAAKLDPAQHRYLFHYANLLVNNERDAEARRLVQKIGATADSPQEKAEAEELLVRIRQHEEWLTVRKERSQGVVAVSDGATSGGTDIRVTGDAAATPKAPVAQRLDSKTTMAVEGKVYGVDCEHAPEIVLSLDFSGSVLALHSANVGLAEVTAARGQSAMGLDNCQEWVGRKVKAWFHMGSGEKYFGEITKLYFF